MKVFLISPPRRYWPFVHEQDNYLVQQWMVCLGAVIRQANFEVRLIDCMVSKIGWRSLAQIIRAESPDVVCIGENHALYCDEALKCFNLIKEINKDIVTIAGGSHFSNLSLEYLAQEAIDFIVVGEGEATIVDLLNHIKDRVSSYQDVLGICYKESGDFVKTGYRPLIPHLDQLPMPAYDLVPMHLYGKAKLLYTPGGTTIFHSRGCTASCKFCSWWTAMADRKEVDGEEILTPRWRTKGYLKTVDEIEYLQKKHNKNCFLFVDESWNINPKFNDNFSEEIFKRNININFFAFIRADCLLRDEKNGLFEKMVKAGLCHLCIGVERAANKDLTEFGKKFYANEQSIEVFDLLNRKYPTIFKQATFIVGLRDETKESFYDQMEFAKRLNADHPAFHPITPVPGTELFREAREKNWLVTEDFRKFDWMTPVMKTKYLDQYEIQKLIYEVHKKLMTPKWIIKGLLSKTKYKRNMYLWWLVVTTKVFFHSLFKRVNPFKEENYTHLVTPKWYDK